MSGPSLRIHAPAADSGSRCGLGAVGRSYAEIRALVERAKARGLLVEAAGYLAGEWFPTEATIEDLPELVRWAVANGLMHFPEQRNESDTINESLEVEETSR